VTPGVCHGGEAKTNLKEARKWRRGLTKNNEDPSFGRKNREGSGKR